MLVLAVIILSFLLPLSCIFSFLIGAQIYQKSFYSGLDSSKGNIPSKENRIIKPKAKKTVKSKYQERIDTLYANIDAYDGTHFGQTEIK